MSRSTTTLPTRASSARRHRTRASSAAGILLLLLAGCAGYSPGDIRNGASEAELRARMGEPTGREALPGGGARIEYARGPMGKHTYMVELDASGQVRGWEQVLTEANFESIAPGAPQADVRRKLGRPSETRVGWRGVGEVWSYRYESLFCRWFQVWLFDGRVREAAYAMDPMCDRAEGRSRLL
jgi:hypothetical protein